MLIFVEKMLDTLPMPLISYLQLRDVKLVKKTYVKTFYLITKPYTKLSFSSKTYNEKNTLTRLFLDGVVDCS